MSLADIIFLLAVTWLLNHELDAIQQHEWRFFFGASFDETTAHRLFVGAHIPLFFLILLGLNNPGFQLFLDLFLIFHAGLHFVLRNHPGLNFNSSFSRFWIYGAAILAMSHLIISHVTL